MVHAIVTFYLTFLLVAYILRGITIAITAPFLFLEYTATNPWRDTVRTVIGTWKQFLCFLSIPAALYVLYLIQTILN